MAFAIAALALACTGPALAAETLAKVDVETFTLDNGMTFLLVRKPEMTTVSAGWVAHVGSANERPGITGVSHLFEHMMFKGTRTVGTKDIKRDLEIIAEQEELQEQIRQQYEQQAERWRKGEIADPFDPKNRTPELVELEKKFQALVEEQRSLMVKDEFDQIYTEAGGSGMNAFTNTDMTVYFITVPANKLELWFWMESDRLSSPVFREFYSERDVVHEERRLRTESTPTGQFDELFESMFWQAHPYGWPVVGWPSDLRMISKAQADDYFATYYAPNNLKAAIVGSFDPAQVKQLAERYFGRIPRGPRRPPQVVTLELPQTAEQRLAAECDCQPQVTIGYKTVPFEHKDSYALDVLSELMNGRSGRLYKSLVLDKKIASSAWTGQDARKWAGAFLFRAETKGDATPEQLEQAWYEELARIQQEPIPAAELQKVKNQITAGAYRRLENPFFLMVQLLYFDGLGDWRYINEWADKTLAVTDADIKRVAAQYFPKENRNVAVYNRKAGTSGGEVPPELAELPAEARSAVLGQLKQLRGAVAGMTDPAQLEQMLQMIQSQESAAPPEMRRVFPLFKKVVSDRLEQLQGEGGQQPAAPQPNEGGAR